MEVLPSILGGRTGFSSCIALSIWSSELPHHHSQRSVRDSSQLKESSGRGTYKIPTSRADSRPIRRKGVENRPACNRSPKLTHSRMILEFDSTTGDSEKNAVPRN